MACRSQSRAPGGVKPRPLHPSGLQYAERRKRKPALLYPRQVRKAARWFQRNVSGLWSLGTGVTPPNGKRFKYLLETNKDTQSSFSEAAGRSHCGPSPSLPTPEELQAAFGHAGLPRST